MTAQSPLPILALMVLLVLSGIATTTAQQGTTEEVEATDELTFEPDTIEIEAGTTVRWTNSGTVDHTATSRDDLFNEEIPAGSEASFTFDEPGTYEYYCIPHENVGMTGTVTVTAADDSTGADPGADADMGGDGDTGGEDDTTDTPGPAGLLFLAALGGLFYLGRRR